MSQTPRVEERDADVSLFDLTYEQYHRSLHAYLLGKAGEAATEDLLQETFLRVWRHVADLRLVPVERRRYWLFALARNVVTDHYRRNSVRRRHEMQADEDGAAVRRCAAPVTQTEHDDCLDIGAAMARLPEGLRTIVAMRYLGEMDSAEIGDAVGMPAGTVRYQLASARRQLAGELGLAYSREAVSIEEKVSGASH